MRGWGVIRARPAGRVFMSGTALAAGGIEKPSCRSAILPKRSTVLLFLFWLIVFQRGQKFELKAGTRHDRRLAPIRSGNWGPPVLSGGDARLRGAEYVLGRRLGLRRFQKVELGDHSIRKQFPS